MLKTIILFLVLVISVTSWAYEAPASADKPYIFASETASITVVVEAINHETRAVSLRGPEGGLTELVVSDEVRNLDQVEVGDKLVVEVEKSMEVEVFAAENAEAGAANLAAMSRSELGEKPSIAAIDTTVINAVVEEINLDENTFKLRGVDGIVKEFIAKDPENLKKAAVGDLVVITYTEAIAISVEAKTEE